MNYKRKLSDIYLISHLITNIKLDIVIRVLSFWVVGFVCGFCIPYIMGNSHAGLAMAVLATFLMSGVLFFLWDTSDHTLSWSKHWKVYWLLNAISLFEKLFLNQISTQNIFTTLIGYMAAMFLGVLISRSLKCYSSNPILETNEKKVAGFIESLVDLRKIAKIFIISNLGILGIFSTLSSIFQWKRGEIIDIIKNNSHFFRAIEIIVIILLIIDIVLIFILKNTRLSQSISILSKRIFSCLVLITYSGQICLLIFILVNIQYLAYYTLGADAVRIEFQLPNKLLEYKNQYKKYPQNIEEIISANPDLENIINKNNISYKLMPNGDYELILNEEFKRKRLLGSNFETWYNTKTQLPYVIENSKDLIK